MASSPSIGTVYLVGAGPGDPGLITVRGRDLLARAHVVVYDSLVNEALLAHATAAERVFVGKRAGRHALTQADIQRVLIDHARAGRTVVRLKGGDPLIFGRGGEEGEALRAAGVPFEIVPGVTAGTGIAAYAGVPLTHRGVSGSVTFLTGHLDPKSGKEGLALDRLHLDGTLVLYMATAHLAALAEALIARGRAAETPAVAVEWGTLPRQRTIAASLGTLAQQCATEGLGAPAIVIIGEVVSLRETLSWFESRPLYGKRIAVTRAKRRAGDLVNRLRDLGAEVFEFPTVEIEPAHGGTPFPDVAEFAWVVMTSVNGVEALFDGLCQHRHDIRRLHGVRLCAIGAKTAEGLSQRFLNVDAQPDAYDPEAAIAAMEAAAGPITGQRVLLPRADIAREDLPKALRNHGAEVTELVAFTAAVPHDAEALADRLVAFAPHIVTFNSASAARNFAAIVGPERIASLRAIYAAIGPIAAEAAAMAGMPCAIVPDAHRVDSLVQAIVKDGQ